MKCVICVAASRGFEAADGAAAAAHLPPRNIEGSLSAHGQQRLEHVSIAAGRSGSDLPVDPASLSSHEDVLVPKTAMPGLPLKAQRAQLKWLRESEFYVSLTVRGHRLNARAELPFCCVTKM